MPENTAESIHQSLEEVLLASKDATGQEKKRSSWKFKSNISLQLQMTIYISREKRHSLLKAIMVFLFEDFNKNFNDDYCCLQLYTAAF